MSSWFDSTMRSLAQRRVAWRRARNLRAAGGRPRLRPSPLLWAGCAGALLALGGAILLAVHARNLSASVPADVSSAADGALRPAGVFQPLVAGAAFSVPAQAGMSVTAHGGGALVIAAGMQGAAPVRIDLCSQLADPGGARMLPLRIGYRFDELAGLAARAPGAVRNAVLAGPRSAWPRIQLSGSAGVGQALQLRWDTRAGTARWVGEQATTQGAAASGQARLLQDGWLIFDAAAVRLQRRASRTCAQAGELTVQLFTPKTGTFDKALVAAYGGRGGAASAWLAPGAYQVPQAPPAHLEDQALFAALTAQRLVRLGAGGLVEVAPRDLAAWQGASGGARAAHLHGWGDVVHHPERQKLIERLYRMADGDYVRAQVALFNSERRLLGWRVRPSAASSWQASVGAAPAASVAGMPPAAARLFAEVPQGWAPWSRVAHWPAAAANAPARLTMLLPQPWRHGATLELMVAGRVAGVDGARIVSRKAACTGRACPATDAVETLVLAPDAGAHSVSLSAAPLDLAAMSRAGDAHYRHLRIAAGQLEWRPLPGSAARAPRAPLAGVTLTDRHGILLWSGGAPSASAAAAGLAPLLGLRADHANSVAGMLARVASPGGMPHQARLSIDLSVQAATQSALECVGMGGGRWDGSACSGARHAPPGRQAGMVIVDTETGDVLAAAGASAGAVGAANWEEVRDFDRANPAGSPLRLPALQHDGGAHRSPGSTFKIVSALGLELAALRDPRIEAMVAGMPLAALNQMARARGFAFQTNAATYPFNTQLAHITNYKEQHLDRRAQDGRLGVAQALTYSLNTWFAFSCELTDRSLLGRPDGGMPDVQALQTGALDAVRPTVAMARRLGFEQPLRLDGGLLPADFAWSAWDALQASAAHIDPIRTRHELRQMAIGLRMQVTPLQMALVAGAVGQGSTIAPRLLLALDGRDAAQAPAMPLGVRVDRIRAGLKGVVDVGTAAGAFDGAPLAAVRRGLSGKTGTSPSGDGELATVWFTGFLEPGTLPGQRHRLALAAFVSHSDLTGGAHAAPVVAAVLASMARARPEQKGK